MATKPEDRKPNTPADAPDKPAAKEQKGEKRLFQKSPGEKVLMTKEEATKAGHFWAD